MNAGIFKVVMVAMPAGSLPWLVSLAAELSVREVPHEIAVAG